MEQAIIWAVVWAAIGLIGWVLLYFGGAILGGVLGGGTRKRARGQREFFDSTGGALIGAIVGWILGLILGAFSLIQVIINIVTAIQIGTSNG